MKAIYFSLILSLLESIAKAQTNVTNSSLLTTLAGIPELSNLTTYFQPYQQMLTGLTNITLLAPTNDAFAIFLNSSTAGALGSDSGLLAAILDYHLLNGTYDDLAKTSFISTALEPGAYANVTGGQRVETLPDSGNATIVSGLLESATVYDAVAFTDGFVYRSSKFLMLPQNISTTAVALNLTSAVGALTNSSLALTVDNTRDLTMFVPNNAAFQQIGGTLANLTFNDLASILEYHVVPGDVLYSTDLRNGASMSTLQGNQLNVRVIDNNIYVNNGKVVFPNALTRNGVIHVIDRVLNPDNSSASIGGEAFAGATSASGVPFTSGVQTPTSSISLPSSSTTSGSTTESGSGSNSHSNAGAIAGGVVGGVLLVAFGLFLFWFVRRRRAGNNPQGKSATSNSSGHDGAAVTVGRKETTKSYHKPELEATTKSYQKPELEADTVSSTDPQQKFSAPAMNEIDTPMSRVRTELSGSTAPHGTTGTPVSPTIARQESSTQEKQRLLLHQQEEEESRLAEIAHQRRKAELDYQKKMAELEHEQRMAELDITAARLRSRNRTVSELEARANPGPGSPE